jgi:hypothetical protein
MILALEKIVRNREIEDSLKRIGDWGSGRITVNSTPTRFGVFLDPVAGSGQHVRRRCPDTIS